MSDHFNHDFDGGAPDIPVSVGDRFYGQDRSLDFNWMRNQIGKVLEDRYGQNKVLVSGGHVIQGAGDTLTISPAVAVVPFEITQPGDFSVANPPSTSVEDVQVRVESTQQTDLAIGSATLDGTTVNYVKLAYAEIAQDNRTRAKKSGSYDYKVTPSFILTVDSTPPTSYEIELARFTGLSAGTFDVINRYPEMKFTGQLGEALSAGDPVGVGLDGKLYKAQYSGVFSGSWFSNQIFSGDYADVCRLDKGVFLSLNSELAGPLIGVRAGEVTDTTGTINWLTARTQIFTPTVGANGECFIAPLGDDTGYFVAVLDPGAVTTNMIYRVGHYDAGAGTIVFDTAETNVAIPAGTDVAQIFVHRLETDKTVCALGVRGNATAAMRWLLISLTAGPTVNVSGTIDTSSNATVPLFCIGVRPGVVAPCWKDATDGILEHLLYSYNANVSTIAVIDVVGAGAREFWNPQALAGGFVQVERWHLELGDGSWIFFEHHDSTQHPKIMNFNARDWHTTFPTKGLRSGPEGEFAGVAVSGVAPAEGWVVAVGTEGTAAEHWFHVHIYDRDLNLVLIGGQENSTGVASSMPPQGLPRVAYLGDGVYVGSMAVTTPGDENYLDFWMLPKFIGVLESGAALDDVVEIDLGQVANLVNDRQFTDLYIDYYEGTLGETGTIRVGQAIYDRYRREV